MDVLLCKKVYSSLKQFRWKTGWFLNKKMDSFQALSLKESEPDHLLSSPESFSQSVICSSP